MIFKAFFLYIVGFSLIGFTTIASENIEDQGPEFHEYSREYFEYAKTPQQIVEDVIIPEKPRILEIGSAKGYFIEEVLLTAAELTKKVGFAAVEFNNESRGKIKGIFELYKEPPYNHECVLARDPNVIDYIHRNPDKKKGFFTSIVSFYSLHCLCPSDLIEVLLAGHDFLKSNGTLWLTLQCAEAVGDSSLSQEDLEERYKEGDLFPGYNLDENRTKNRIGRFLDDHLVYPLSIEASNKNGYTDPHLFAHDFAPLLPTIHDKRWTKTLLEVCGFDVEVCDVIADSYPAEPLEEGEVSDGGIETEYVFVKAYKEGKIPNLDAIGQYRVAAKEKENRVFELYQEIVSQR